MTTLAITTVPKKNDSSACRSVVTRTVLEVIDVSDTWYVIPTVTAKYAKSEYRGGSSWLNEIPPGVPL